MNRLVQFTLNSTNLIERTPGGFLKFSFSIKNRCYVNKYSQVRGPLRDAVRFGQALPGYLITAHHLHAPLR